MRLDEPTRKGVAAGRAPPSAAAAAGRFCPRDGILSGSLSTPLCGETWVREIDELQAPSLAPDLLGSYPSSRQLLWLWSVVCPFALSPTGAPLCNAVTRGEDCAEGAGGPVRAPFRPLEKRL